MKLCGRRCRAISRFGGNYSGCRYHCVVTMTPILLPASRKNSAIPLIPSPLPFSYTSIPLASASVVLFLLSTTPVSRSDSRSRRDYRYRFNQRQAKYYSILRASLPILRLTVYYLCVKCKISIFSSFFFS